MPAGRRNRSLIILVGLVLLVAGTYFWLQHRSPALSEREYATRLLAEYAKSAAKPKAVFVFGNPFADLPNRPAQVYNFEKAGLVGLKRGFGPEIPVKVGHPKVNPAVLSDPGSVRIDPKSPTPLSFVIDSTAFDELLKTNPDCDLAVSLIGLPVNLSTMESWNKAGAPRFALLLPDWRMIGDVEGIEKAFSSGKLVAAVVTRPNTAETNDPKERYLVIDGKNFAQNFRTYPQLFGF